MTRADNRNRQSDLYLQPAPAPLPSPPAPTNDPYAPAADSPHPSTHNPTTTASPSSTPIVPRRTGPKVKVIGIVFGSLLILGIIVIFFIWRKKRSMRQPAFDRLSAASPRSHQSKADDELGGPPLHWEKTFPRGTTLLPKPTPSTRHPTTCSDSEYERPYQAVTNGFSDLGLSQQSNFTYEELSLATNGFSNSNLLGRGGFGYVYKGVLPNGKTVAIKQLKSGSKQGEREFRAEVEVISRVHHRHLVSLVGYSIAGARRMMLVYEFVPNNTLEFHLHGEGGAIMEWTTRMKIAIGSAKGLAYLHEDCKPKVIHRDIKAANILLDDNFEPKVADFGLARISADTDTHVSTRVMGTFGYLAPEYAASGKLTEKSDVFSFGVVLLELITGRKPVGKTEFFTDDSMVEWARPLLTEALENGNFEALSDPRLQNNYNCEEMFQMVSCAANCVRHSAGRRPRMSQVVQALLGNISLDDLNEESTPMRQNSDELKNWWKVALEGVEYNTGEYSEPSSESGQHHSTSSSSGHQITPTYMNVNM